MSRVKVKMLKDWSSNVDKEGQNRTIYEKGSTLMMSEEQAKDFEEEGTGKIVKGK